MNIQSGWTTGRLPIGMGSLLDRMNLLEEGDLDEALNAASAVRWPNTKRSPGIPVPDALPRNSEQDSGGFIRIYNRYLEARHIYTNNL